MPKSAELPVFDTYGHADPFGYWHDTICSNFTALSAERRGEGDFRGTIAVTQQMGECTMSAIRSGAQIVRRTRQDIARSPTDTVFVNFQLTGSSRISQRGIDARVPAGSVVVLDARRPFAMDFEQGFRQACLHLPVGEITRQGARCADILGRVLPLGQARAPALTGELQTMLAGGANQDTVVSLVALLLAGIHETADLRLADQHLALIRKFVDRNAADPGLSPRGVADHFRISVRHLHKLFARSDQSFGQYLLSERLVMAERLVRETSLPIATIANLVGISSPSYFSRAFHARFGTSARTYRHRCRC